MASIQVHNKLDDLAADTRWIAVNTKTKLSGVTAKYVEAGKVLSQGFAQERSGPHGRLYYKRITSEMFSPLSGEWGPNYSVIGIAVGAGWRHGAGNTDLPRAADIIVPRWADEIGDQADELFW